MSHPPPLADGRRHLLAGSAGRERAPARPDPAEPRWFEPLHVRDPAAARTRVAEQVVAGATVVVAPTWRTHRRALLPLGETRRARAWTASAVQVAREGTEVGAERRSAAGVSALARVLVVAALPALEGEPEAGTGRLLPREAASERDYRDQAGLLADAEVDAILVEGQLGMSSARLAMEAAADTGLPTWAVAWLRPDPGARFVLADGSSPQEWLTVSLSLGVGAVLVRATARAAPLLARAREGDASRWGALRPAVDATADDLEGWAAEWLAAGADVIGIDEGATPPSLAAMRRALDRAEAADRADREGAVGRWGAFVAQAARRASGGAALWIGDPAGGELPPGFAWTSVTLRDLPLLPEGHFRLVVCCTDDGPGEDPERPVMSLLARSLDDGGILVLRGDVLEPGDGSRLRLVTRDAGDRPSLAAYRRERR